VLSQGYKAVLMGQRSTDPYADHLSHFSMCDQGWPQVMRVNPILEWGYRHVWVFLRECRLAYCPLYDQGFTSLGPVTDTSVNPMLAHGDAPPRPAYELHEDHHDQVSLSDAVSASALRCAALMRDVLADVCEHVCTNGCISTSTSCPQNVCALRPYAWCAAMHVPAVGLSGRSAPGLPKQYTWFETSLTCCQS
jgi:3'-phosphoadenosine 5'-phosphosulfate sulfotransferase (PAPS reductase)/FAD synthetase